MILLEHGPEGKPAAFLAPSRRITAWTADQVLPALAALDAARASGLWVAGQIAYEAGFALERALAGLMPQDQAFPLLAFGIYDAPSDPGVLLEAAGAGGARIAPLRPAISPEDYAAAFAVVKAHIAAGNCYQINLTFPLDSALVSGTPLGLYGALRARQPVGFGAFVELGEGPVLVSRSPELFFRTTAQGRIESRPMKGTAPRDADPVRDAELAEALRHSPKDRAENLMIVDLLRNDIARISRVGSVRVPELFAVESFATVHQMTSRVIGQLTDPPALTRLIPALFPCGSITGAPKIRAMQIIAEVEPHRRGAYCGAIGWMAPDGASCFNVAIRTLSLTGPSIRLNAGGGVVQDSTAAGEWEEALWKTRYLSSLIRPG
jgi:para-aminobenzoate synthetase component 1